jgi:hypothetical protein
VIRFAPRPGTAAAAALLGALALPALAGAQSAPDFLFKDPRVSLSLRMGYSLPTVASDVFDFTRTELTVSDSDFHSASWGAQLAIRTSERVDVAIDVGFSKSTTRSEYREWVDQDDLPIEQDTEFRRVPLTVGAKVYLAERGRRIGRFAWIPEKWVPFVGASAGWVWYEFIQEGDFVDFETLGIGYDRFTSGGAAPTIHVFGGADWSLNPSLFLTAEGRYAWAKADMDRDFVNFDRIDLSGFQASAGISLRF